MQRVWSRDLVGKTRHMRRVVVAMTGLVVAICENSQMTLRVCRRELWLRAGIMQCLTTRVQAKVEVLFRATQALAARMALTSGVVG